jgi:hypothetical protein
MLLGITAPPSFADACKTQCCASDGHPEEQQSENGSSDHPDPCGHSCKTHCCSACCRMLTPPDRLVGFGSDALVAFAPAIIHQQAGDSGVIQPPYHPPRA